MYVFMMMKADLRSLFAGQISLALRAENRGVKRSFESGVISPRCDSQGEAMSHECIAFRYRRAKKEMRNADLRE